MAKPNPHADPASGTDDDTSPPRCCPVFTPMMLRRQLVIDRTMRWAIVLALVGYLLFDAPLNLNDSMWSTLLVLLIFAAWFAMGVVGTRVAQQIPQITMLIDQDRQAADTQLAKAIRRKPMPRSVRLLLYHRLAMLRQKQQRHDEVTVICQALLSQRPGVGHGRDTTSVAAGTSALFNVTRRTDRGPVHAHLLLMLAESHLHRRDLPGAYWALLHLHRCRLSLVDLLQLLVLQCRYEVMAGYGQATLNQVEKKISLAELMPASGCGTMHVLLTLAAAQTKQTLLGQWLNRRAQLLCTPDQLQVLARAAQ